MPPRHILTILAVADLARSVDFYTRAFGWPARVNVPVYVQFELPDGNALGLYRREAFAHNTGQAPEAVPAGAITGTELYLRCEDLAEGARRVQAASERAGGVAGQHDHVERLKVGLLTQALGAQFQSAHKPHGESAVRIGYGFG